MNEDKPVNTQIFNIIFLPDILACIYQEICILYILYMLNIHAKNCYMTKKTSNRNGHGKFKMSFNL